MKISRLKPLVLWVTGKTRLSTTKDYSVPLRWNKKECSCSAALRHFHKVRIVIVMPAETPVIPVPEKLYVPWSVRQIP